MWKQKAEALFFIEHKKINDIAEILGVARETISRYLSGLSGYDKEKNYRRELGKKNKKLYQKKWNDNKGFNFSGLSLRREHEIAVRVLSSDRF